MASFVGTTQKCTVCDKTAYPVDRLTADSRVYHKACFRCHHCRNTLKLSNYCSFEGVLYCRLHYDQLYKRTGSLDKSFEGTPKIQKPEKQSENENAKVLSNVFLGTKDKCSGCQKTVYPTERITVNGTPYHKGCFKCSHGGCTITSANFVSHEGKLYCKHHHVQLFKEKGNYSQLDSDRAGNPSLKENEGNVEGEAQLFDGEQGCNDDCTSLCETESSLVSMYSSPTWQENVSCSSSREFVSESDLDQQLAGDVTPMSVSLSEREEKNRDPQKVLEKLNFQLLDKNGRAMPIQVKYRTSVEEKKKKKKKGRNESNSSLNC